MKTLSALTVCCLLSLAVFILVSEAQTNGTIWNHFQASQKVMYVQGFLSGYSAGIVDGAAIGTETYAPKPLPPDAKDLIDVAKRHWSSINGSRHANEELANEVDAFYRDYKNVAVCWTDAVFFSDASLAGHAPSEQELDAARRDGAKSGCKVETR